MDENVKTASTLQLLMAAQSRVFRLVCSGGGAKGVMYPGAYVALVETGVFKGIKAISGASAGALTASLLAVGMPPATFRDKLLKTHFKNLLGNRVKDKLPGVSFITKDGLPLEQFIRFNIIDSICAVLSKSSDIAKRAQQDPALNTLFDKLGRANPRITFADLALLQKHFPTEFKLLTVSAVSFPTGELQIFNSELTPDVEIALACRASASIPILLSPVEIEINGVKQRFVDGGLYDNLPTDYFDRDAQGRFEKNKHPLNTLVFAFGEGLNNDTNQVFKALYGARWDEAVTDEILHSILAETVHILDQDDAFESPQEEAKFIIHALRFVLKKLVNEGKFQLSESKTVGVAIENSIKHLILSNPFWSRYKSATQEERIDLLETGIKEHLRPILYNPGFLEQFKRNVLVRVFGDLNLPYKNTDQKEQGYQKLRTDYAFRTVELRVGNIKTTDFNAASKEARLMDALGYLDTINHITNQDLHDSKTFNAAEFYDELVDHFIHIYEAVLLAAKQNLQQDPLLQEIKALKTQLTKRAQTPVAAISRQTYQLIKDKVEQQLNSVEAFALTRAVEFNIGTLSAEDLFKETYEEGFHRSGPFSQSTIAGERIFKQSTLHAKLKDKNMFDLLAHRNDLEKTSRTALVHQSLSQIKSF